MYYVQDILKFHVSKERSIFIKVVYYKIKEEKKNKISIINWEFGKLRKRKKLKIKKTPIVAQYK